MVLAAELAHQPVGEVVEVMQPVAQVGIGLAQHAGARIGLDPLDGRFGGQSGHHRLTQASQPAAVVGEHAVGLQHIAMLPAVRDLAAFEHDVEVGLQHADQLVQPLELLVDVVGDEIGDDHPRLVQHDVAEGDPFGDRQAPDMQGTADGRLEPGLGERRELAGSDHLGDHHGDRLECLRLLLRVGAARPVLHHQHAERVAGPQDRHAEERVINLFSGLRPVGERGVLVRLRQVDRVGFASDQADQPFVGTEHRDVDGFRLEALAGVQLEAAVDAQHVDGTHLRHHVGGDQHDDLVEALLRADRFRHHLAEPAQQHAGTAERASHGVRSLWQRPRP